MHKGIFLLLALLAPGLAQSADSATVNKSGEHLHNTHCMACHNNSVYTRKDRRVKTKLQLIQQVKGCDHQMSKNFSQKETSDLVEYLNQSFYKFKK